MKKLYSWQEEISGTTLSHNLTLIVVQELKVWTLRVTYPKYAKDIEG